LLFPPPKIFYLIKYVVEFNLCFYLIMKIDPNVMSSSSALRTRNVDDPIPTSKTAAWDKEGAAQCSGRLWPSRKLFDTCSALVVAKLERLAGKIQERSNRPQETALGTTSAATREPGLRIAGCVIAVMPLTATRLNFQGAILKCSQ
jgi:hypothetical protein